MGDQGGENKLYLRLQTDLAAVIKAAQPGERLPTEPELAKRLGVSRATLREAMRSFEAQGLIRRRQGVGTFVVPQAQVIQTGLEVLESIETLARRMKLQVSLGALNIRQVSANAEQAKELGVEDGSALVEVARVIYADGRPVAYLIDLLPEIYLQKVDLETGFTGSVLDLLLKRGTPQLAHSLTEIRAGAAPSEIARALEIQRGDVLLVFVAHLYSNEGNVVDYSYSYFLPGYFSFQVVRRVGGVV